ncbi:MAG: hypothetical protein MUE40_18620, partial [Anaerolineae bacterium]|nr:hypothetical protein [Anaerolineae bacterium]
LLSSGPRVYARYRLRAQFLPPVTAAEAAPPAALPDPTVTVTVTVSPALAAVERLPDTGAPPAWAAPLRGGLLLLLPALGWRWRRRRRNARNTLQ